MSKHFLVQVTMDTHFRFQQKKKTLSAIKVLSVGFPVSFEYIRPNNRKKITNHSKWKIQILMEGYSAQ